jgi:hypothetical protein
MAATALLKQMSSCFFENTEHNTDYLVACHKPFNQSGGRGTHYSNLCHNQHTIIIKMHNAKKNKINKIFNQTCYS